jgi:hypothetical protein
MHYMHVGGILSLADFYFSLVLYIDSSSAIQLSTLSIFRQSKSHVSTRGSTNASRVKCTGQTARAARTHPSYSFLLTLIVALELWLQFEECCPDEPAVAIGFPLHLVTAPAALTVSTFT